MTDLAHGTERLTREQGAALQVQGQSVALSAGAGCGKTTVLSERFLSEIEGSDGRPLRALVALTFTDKAARELRQRIRDRCRERMAGGEGAERWRTVLRALEAAPIGTFHEFAGRLLRAHAVEIGLDPEFEILDEAVASTLRDQAIRSTLRRLLAERSIHLTHPAIDYGLGQIREALASLLATRTSVELESWGELQPQELVDRWSRVWEERGRPAALRSLAPIARCCRSLLSGLEAAHPKLQERRAQLLDRLSTLEEGTCSEADLHEVRILARVSDLGAKGIWPGPEIKKAVQIVFTALRKKLDDILEKLAINPELTLESAGTSLRIIKLAARARAEYEAVKRERHGLDFDDLLIKARELLADGPQHESGSLADREAIEFVLVDEFQDTDRVQSEILRRLGDASFFRGRMFVVGDTKQSIYRFRGAEPAFFDRWRAEFPEPGRLSLTENFRSVPAVIHFVNALFADCFIGEPAREDGEHEHRLTPVRTDHSETPAVTFFWALPSTGDGEAEQPQKPSAGERKTNEARCLARWICDRLKADWKVLERKSRQLRQADAGDVAFLFRAMTDVWHYESALAEFGLDYYTIGGSAFYAQQEVRDLVNVLSVVEDPLDQVALAGALRGPFFNLSDAALFWLTRPSAGRLTDGILRTGDIVQLSERDRALTARAVRLLGRWRTLKDRIPLDSLLDLILDESGFEAALVCEFLGARKLANLRKLVRLARNFDRQQGFTLADLVARLQADLDSLPREEQAATTDEDSRVIRLMSIHQAKGLEFPIVVIPDLNRDSSPPRGLLGLHPELGLVVRPPRSPGLSAEADAEPEAGESLGWLTYRSLENEEDRKESLRLFYVAATRARDRLVLSAGLETEPVEGDPVAAYLTAAGCSFNNPGSPRASSPAMQLVLERFDWRSGACLAQLPEGWPTPRVSVVLATPAEPQERGRRPSRQLDQEIERAIGSAVSPDAQPVVPIPSLPALIDLDPDPNTPGRAARLDRLIRALLADRALLQGEPLADVCARLAARQVPAAGLAIQQEAIRCLEPWLESPLFSEVKAASRGRRSLERSTGWMLPWPLEGAASTVIRGRCDLLWRDRRGFWRPVVVSTDSALHETDQLCLLLSPTAVERMGRGPSGSPWWVEARPGANPLVEARFKPTKAIIDKAVAHWLDQNVSRGNRI
jgi:ATP-dependent helicase/nuclease subunit A